MHPQETVGQHSAIQEGAQLPLDKVRNGAIPLPLPGQEGLQMFGDNSVEGILLRIPGTIGGFGSANEESLIPLLKTVIVEYRVPNGRAKGRCIAASLR